MTLIYNVDTDSHIEIFTGDVVYKMAIEITEPIGTIVTHTDRYVRIKKFDGSKATMETKDLLYFKNKIQYLKF
jgi:hypothetical protein